LDAAAETTRGRVMDEEALKVLMTVKIELDMIQQYIRQGDINLALWELGRIHTAVAHVVNVNAAKIEEE
jgi:FAD synthase